MFQFPVQYEGRVYRPPSEGRSLLFQVTIGCSNNKCTYCAMYRDKVYRERKLEEVLLDIEKASEFYKRIGMSPSKIFLCDGDALGASMDLLVPVLDKINECFPEVRRIGVYATAENMLEKTDEELKLLVSKKLSIAYLGMESGDDDVLKLVVKGNTAKDMVDASLKMKRAGFQLSVIAMLGLGGKKFSKQHCENTAKVISKISPDFFSFLNTTPVPGTPYFKMSERKTWQKLSDKELLMEMRDILSMLEPENGRIVFRANHVSNLFPLGGNLPNDKDKILLSINEWISNCPDDLYTEMDPEMM